MPVYYFIHGTTLKSGWFKQLPSEKTVEIPDRLYKMVEEVDVRMSYDEAGPPVNFTMLTAEHRSDLRKIKKFHTVEVDEGLRFFFDDEYGFLESEKPRPLDAMHVFERLLNHRGAPFIFFLEGD
jgi:hypothetical protein